jgi:hypothetical protein
MAAASPAQRAADLKSRCAHNAAAFRRRALLELNVLVKCKLGSHVDVVTRGHPQGSVAIARRRNGVTQFDPRKRKI